MKLTIEGEAKEVAAFLLEVGKRPREDYTVDDVEESFTRALESTLKRKAFI